MVRQKIKEILKNPHPWIDKEVKISGWVRTLRHQKSFSFIEVNDGSTLNSLQIIADHHLQNYENLLSGATTGAAVSFVGRLVRSPPDAKQIVELKAQHFELIGPCSENYPLQKKRHSFEFLRTIAHLRPRTNTMGAIVRLRSELSFAIHRFFYEKGFLYLHTPLITHSDCEGGGKLFQVTTLNLEDLPKNEKKEVDYNQDFFAKPAYLTVSGQLNAEIYAQALSDVYTFGPTFRAENSNTSRHLAEFWMIEPEMAFASLEDDMNLAETFLKNIFRRLLDTCEEEMAFFDRFIKPGVINRLQGVIEKPFERITYTQAIEILQKSQHSFEYPVHWGADLQSEHERFLTQEHFKKPVIVSDYPASIKAFYMRANDDGKTVAAMDVLVPDVGEIIGGSAREERMEPLIEKMKQFGIDTGEYEWYLDLRRYGSVPHAGFGAGFERLLLFATGMENIRDVIAFPRYPGYLEF